MAGPVSPGIIPAEYGRIEWQTRRRISGIITSIYRSGREYSARGPFRIERIVRDMCVNILGRIIPVIFIGIIIRHYGEDKRTDVIVSTIHFLVFMGIVSSWVIWMREIRNNTEYPLEPCECGLLTASSIPHIKADKRLISAGVH